MPLVDVNNLKASRIGNDIIIKADHIKLAIQHAFIVGSSFDGGDVEREGWTYANNILEKMILNKKTEEK